MAKVLNFFSNKAVYLALIANSIGCRISLLGSKTQQKLKLHTFIFLNMIKSFSYRDKKLNVPFLNFFNIYQTRCSWGCSTNTFIINLLRNSVSQAGSDPLWKYLQKHLHYQPVRARELKLERRLTSPTCYLSYVTCNMSCVKCHT